MSPTTSSCWRLASSRPGCPASSAAAGRRSTILRRCFVRWPITGSTGLAFSMHTHQVAIPAWRWRHQKIAAVEPLLQRVAKERIMLLSSGGSDLIGGSARPRRSKAAA